MIILKAAAALLSAIIMIFSASGITEVVPYLAVIPDMVRVGKDYINLQRNEDAISKKELKTELEANRGKEHPFVLREILCQKLFHGFIELSKVNSRCEANQIVCG